MNKDDSKEEELKMFENHEVASKNVRKSVLELYASMVNNIR